ncbi:MAG: prephenate dehydrogenase/arogenate dehydrogenase family protein [Acidobacteriaceae bacterium]|nr:prephenate dehydrogenase/arogenate dehydrogenase family protein [Acidobacteriaceae bacterium]
MKTIAVVGVGLIGASFALAVRKAGFRGEIVGVSSSRSIAEGVSAGAINRGVTLEEAAASADLIYLSQPIDQIIRTLKALGPIVRAGCLVTDAGSTKSAIVNTALEHVHRASFIGGHPMAGKEQRGAAAADANLFRGRPYVLTPMNRAESLQHLIDILNSIGAEVIEMSPERHDETVALTSHLPQVLSTTLASFLNSHKSEDMLRVFGPGLVDMTRLALSTPDVWVSILETNKPAVLKAMTLFEAKMGDVRKKLESGELAADFEQGAQFAARMRKVDRNSPYEK